MRKSMKNIIKLALLLIILNSGCSYVSDTIEGKISTRSSFSIDVFQSGNDVIVKWDENFDSEDFAGIEIYRTKEPNNEYSTYILIENRWGNYSLGNPYTASFTHVNGASNKGIYFYRVACINWEDPKDERDYPENEASYFIHTEIAEISGSAKIEIK
jgi:hypothetical protein